jgi:hypothetical protein
VFNQDYSAFAVVWQGGGFTKYLLKNLKQELHVSTSSEVSALALIHNTRDYFFSISEEPKRMQNSY